MGSLSQTFALNMPAMDSYTSLISSPMTFPQRKHLLKQLQSPEAISSLRRPEILMGLLDTAAWMPDDDVPAVELPLAKATEKVLSSMHMVLEKTIQAKGRRRATARTRDGIW